MTKIEGQVEEWKEILVDGSVADQLFTLEEISNHINEYPYKDVMYFCEHLLRHLLVFYSKEDTPNELVLIVATILKNIAAYVKDQRERQVIFIKTSKLIPRFLKSHNQTKLMADVMIAYQRSSQGDTLAKGQKERT